MAFDEYYVSKTTLDRLENVFKAGYLSVLNLIAESPDFFILICPFFKPEMIAV